MQEKRLHFSNDFSGMYVSYPLKRRDHTTLKSQITTNSADLRLQDQILVSNITPGMSFIIQLDSSRRTEDLSGTFQLNKKYTRTLNMVIYYVILTTELQQTLTRFSKFS